MKDIEYKESFKAALESNPSIGNWIFDIMQKGRKYHLGIWLTDEKFQLVRDDKFIETVDLNQTAVRVREQLEDIMQKHPFPLKIKFRKNLTIVRFFCTDK